MSAFRSTLPRRFPRHANSPFHAPPPAALEGRQAERLAFLLDRPFAKPRISDPPLPPAPYPSPLDAPLRPGRKPQRSAWLGPEDEAVAQPEIVWAVNPAHARASEAEGRVPSDWFVRRVDRTGFLPVYTEVRPSSPSPLVGLSTSASPRPPSPGQALTSRALPQNHRLSLGRG